MTFDIGLHEACVRVGGRAGVRYVITKFSQMDSLPNFLTHGAPLCARFARARSSAISLGKTFLRLSRIRNIPLTWILGRAFVYVSPFISHILDVIYWTVLIFILIHFEWRDTDFWGKSGFNMGRFSVKRISESCCLLNLTISLHWPHYIPFLKPH